MTGPSLRLEVRVEQQRPLCQDHPEALLRHSWRQWRLERPDGGYAGPEWETEHRWECAVCGKRLS